MILAQIEKESEDASTEFWVGLIGPITSIVIGSVCLGLAWLVGVTPLSPTSNPFAAMLTWLGVINIALAVFNLLPGFPLDGGRVLRGIIWWITGDGAKATRIAAGVGQLFALGFIVIGILRFFGGAGFGGTIGELTTNSFASAGIGGAHLVGLSLGTGFTW